MANITTLDLLFLGQPGLIAAYLLPHSGGAALVETGPGSTIPALQAALKEHGYSPSDVTDVFVTHIHLDHAGAAGWLARHGARIHVHHRGLPHLADPERLLASAGRIYGDQMHALWGDMLPVPSENLTALYDGDVWTADGITLRAVDTPGHATHHMAFVVDDLCFSGDVGGIRLEGPRHILMPMPPPEFHLELWQASCLRLSDLGVARIAPTHFGIYPDAAEHLELLGETLAATADWIAAEVPGCSTAELEHKLAAWMEARSLDHGLTLPQHQKYETANPSPTSAWGIERYWRKYREGGQ